MVVVYVPPVVERKLSISALIEMDSMNRTLKIKISVRNVEFVLTYVPSIMKSVHSKLKRFKLNPGQLGVMMKIYVESVQVAVLVSK